MHLQMILLFHYVEDKWDKDINGTKIYAELSKDFTIVLLRRNELAFLLFFFSGFLFEVRSFLTTTTFLEAVFCTGALLLPFIGG